LLNVSFKSQKSKVKIQKFASREGAKKRKDAKENLLFAPLRPLCVFA
jgi:hypothetical protein